MGPGHRATEEDEVRRWGPSSGWDTLTLSLRVGHADVTSC